MVALLVHRGAPICLFDLDGLKGSESYVQGDVSGLDAEPFEFEQLEPR